MFRKHSGIYLFTGGRQLSDVDSLLMSPASQTARC